MWASIWHYILIAMVLGVASLVINLVLQLLTYGNFKRILFLRTLRSNIAGIPNEVLLSCQKDKVSALVLDRSTAKERAIPLYTGILTWSGGPRPTSKIRRRARRQLIIGTVLFALLFVPLVGAALALTLLFDWRMILVAGILVLHQFIPFRIWEYPGIGALFDRD